MFDFKRFFDVGEDYSKINDEAYVRSAIGRYYYSLFSSTPQYIVEIKKQNSYITGYESHKKIL